MMQPMMNKATQEGGNAGRVSPVLMRAAAACLGAVATNVDYQGGTGGAYGRGEGTPVGLQDTSHQGNVLLVAHAIG